MKKSNLILEMLEKPFLARAEETDYQLSSTPDIEDIEQSLEDNIPTGFFDTGDSNIYSGQGSKNKSRHNFRMK